MDATTIARDNHAFFIVAVGMSMCRDLFVEAVLNSFDGPAQFGVEMGERSGYILIDSTNIKDCFSHGSFIDEIHNGIIARAAREVGYSVTGRWNDRAEVVCGAYKFSFNILQYERDRDHDYEMVDDPVPLPDDERLGRLVEMKITIA